jgi:hypothetical protein
MLKNLFEFFSTAPQEKKTTETTAVKEKEQIHYNFESLRELQEPIRNIVERLQKEIDSGVYDTLISDDASGRLPTIAFREIISQRIDAKNPNLTSEEKRDALKTFFIAGGRQMANKEALAEFLQRIKPDVKRRALLVTEYISTGESLKRVMTLLDKAGILYDVAAVMAGHSEQDYKSLFSDSTHMHRLAIGATGRQEPEIYNAAGLSGVYKPLFEKGAHPLRYVGSEYEPLNDEALGEERQKAREDVHTLAQEVLKEVWEK